MNIDQKQRATIAAANIVLWFFLHMDTITFVKLHGSVNNKFEISFLFNSKINLYYFISMTSYLNFHVHLVH